jgi:DNA polymerase I
VSNNRLLLIDGHSMAYRAFYALPPENFTTSTGIPTNAVYGFTSMLINLLKEFQPTHVAVAFDVSRKSFRTEIYPEYKAGRAKTPDAFKGQVELIKEVMGALSIVTIEKEGFEADDLIATLVTKASQQKFMTEVVTGDRDSFALIDRNTTILYPRKGVSDMAHMTPESFEEKYHLQPNQYPDFAALRGDPSDNLPGVPGVGEKTAEKWIREYGSLASIIENADDLGGKVGDSLRSHIASVLINRRITELIRDVPLDIDIIDLARGDISLERVDQLFDTLQFKALRPRIASLPGVINDLDSQDAATPSEDRDFLQVDVVESIDAFNSLSGPVAVAYAGEFRQGSGRLTSLAATDGRSCITMDNIGEDHIPSVVAWLANVDVPKTLHAGKELEWFMQTHGASVGAVVMDTALASYLLDPGHRSFELNDVVQRFLGISIEVVPEQLTLLGVDEGLTAVLGEHAQIIRKLGEDLTKKLVDFKLMDLLIDLEIPTQATLAAMEHIGIAVNQGALHDLSKEFTARAKSTEQKGFELVGREFNFASPKQLQEVLFVERGLPKTKKIKTGFTTDAEALQQLYVKTGDPLLEQILTWREVSKLRQTVDSLIPLADSHSRIHTTFKQTVAATGRLSSVDPNLQNIPVRTEEGRKIRASFVVGQGYECLMTADYSQIELRIMAHLSGDTALIAAFESGEDLHNTVARRVFDVTEVTPDMRRQIKAMSYGLAYGLSPYGLAAQLDISTEDARIMMDDYFRRFGGIRDYLGRVVETARENLYTETILGRRRSLPDLVSDNRQRREIAERMALNAPIQGSAADIVKIAMLKVEMALREQGAKSRLLLQVHDELVLEVAPGELAETTQIVRTNMENAISLTVPLDVNVGFGPNWDAAAH